MKSIFKRVKPEEFPELSEEEFKKCFLLHLFSPLVAFSGIISGLLFGFLIKQTMFILILYYGFTGWVFFITICVSITPLLFQCAFFPMIMRRNLKKIVRRKEHAHERGKFFSLYSSATFDVLLASTMIIVGIWLLTILVNDSSYIYHKIQMQALAEYEEGNYEQAEAKFKKLLYFDQVFVSNDHSAITNNSYKLVEVYIGTSRFEEAEVLMIQLLEYSEASSSDSHRYRLVYFFKLADIYIRSNRLSEAETMLEESHDIIKAKQKDKALKLMNRYRVLLGRVRMKQERMGEAKDLLTQAYIFSEEEYGVEDSKTREIKGYLDEIDTEHENSLK